MAVEGSENQVSHFLFSFLYAPITSPPSVCLCVCVCLCGSETGISCSLFSVLEEDMAGSFWKVRLSSPDNWTHELL